jgi:hypothetical protein
LEFWPPHFIATHKIHEICYQCGLALAPREMIWMILAVKQLDCFIYVQVAIEPVLNGLQSKFSGLPFVR